MRRVAQAQAFYRGDLASQVEDFVSGFRIPPSIPRRLVGGVVPHAGWRFSGRVAARTLHTLIVRSRPRTFVFFATAHVPGVVRPAIDPEGRWETPAGDVEIDEELAARMLSELEGGLAIDRDAHEGDHAIEVQLPLLRLLAPDAKFVPVAMPPLDEAAEVGRQLGILLREEPQVVVVSSTDLTHYGEPYGFHPAGLGPPGKRFLEENDHRMLEMIRSLDAEAIVDEALKQHNACGPGGLAVAVAAARERGSDRGHIIEYTTSHEMKPEPGPFTLAVGYVGAVF